MKRIFILGAGASISHSKGVFPDIENIFVKNLKYSISASNESRQKYKELFEYIKNNFGINIFEATPEPTINIENIFTYLEIDIEHSSKNKLTFIRDQFMEFLREILIGLEQIIGGDDLDYHKFGKLLRPNDTILTFNWDLMLDNILGREVVISRYAFRGKAPDKEIEEKFKNFYEKQYCNYYVYLTGFGEKTFLRLGGLSPLEDWEGKLGYYFKIHGSVDWFYCNNEDCKNYGKLFPVLPIDKLPICSECYGGMLFLLIPPILNKQYKKFPVIWKIWNAVAKEIEIADEIVIWGYSLPPTDFYAEWICRQAKKIKKLILINPEAFQKGEERNSEFISKFEKIFNCELIPLKTFEQYLDYV